MKSPLLSLALLCAGLSSHLSASTFRIDAHEREGWTKILSSLGLTEASGRRPSVSVMDGNADGEFANVAEKSILVAVGNGALTQALGISASDKPAVTVRRVSDVHAGTAQIIWEQPVQALVFKVPDAYQVFVKERWTGAPLVAGKRTRNGAILWLAVPPGENGFERFPYLPQALVELGLALPAQSTTLWAFFDSGYRLRADPDYLARRWRATGISALHVAGWHNMERDAEADAYLTKLIEACHRHAISVYAWLELPHVSERFWADHPLWREKTAASQDAQLDWRKLMNLQNRECRLTVEMEVSSLLDRFDWDGANVAELYFESLEGAANPARFTPMNDDVRHDFREQSGWDPQLLFTPASPHAVATHPESLEQFLAYRATLAAQLQTEWLATLEKSRSKKPYLDVVLTHIDDRFDKEIRNELGADVARTLPLVEAKHNTLLVEDPATLWALGPQRYGHLASEYARLTHDPSSLGVDINIVERYQDVYPTKKQTGTELFELLHQAAASFQQVALYFENSLEKQDLPLVPFAAANAKISDENPDQLSIETRSMTRIPWRGNVEIDGKPWAIQNDDSVLLPVGKHQVRAGFGASEMTIRDFNGEIRSAISGANRVDISYRSRTRAITTIPSLAKSVELDGAPFAKLPETRTDGTILLPAGQHLVSFVR